MKKPYKRATVFTEGMEDGMIHYSDFHAVPYIIMTPNTVRKEGKFGDYMVENCNGEKDLIDKYYFEENYQLLDQKAMRTLLLQATDWTVLPDNNLTEEEKIEWIVWRSNIREWKSDDNCPIPPNENEYCLIELWDNQLHKPKYI